MAGVPCFEDTFVLNEILVRRINICGGDRHLREIRINIGQFKKNVRNAIGKGGDEGNDVGTLIKPENETDFVNSLIESL